MQIFQFQSKVPNIDPSVFIAPTATVIGDVVIKQNASVWFNCVLRGDVESIAIGEKTNIQDLTMVHTDPESPTRIGNHVTIGHGCVIHGCTIEDNCLIGMGTTILNKAVLGKGSIVAAGAVVLEGSDIPPNSLVAGVPGKVKRVVTDELRQRNDLFADSYVQRSMIYNDSNLFSKILF